MASEASLRVRNQHDDGLSVILICYNMARELPRTLESLSSRMQSAIPAEAYEIIVVDNGSTRPVDRQACLAFGPNIRFLDMVRPGASPGGAIAFGIMHARFPNLGIMVDGARMASPGLLDRARQALRTGPFAVIGTIGFHLGQKPQMEAVHEGYGQAAEDSLLESTDWQKDGYRLFDISCLAGSSSGGWLDLPAETNALFIRRSYYQSLGGYDTRFQSPGGGLINHDFWFRACADPRSDIILLLGEGTFHQFHGGIATNALRSPWDDFAAEYEAICGRPYERPRCRFKAFGDPRCLQRLPGGSRQA
jgi:hypothetical protein